MTDSDRWEALITVGPWTHRVIRTGGRWFGRAWITGQGLRDFDIRMDPLRVFRVSHDWSVPVRWITRNRRVRWSLLDETQNAYPWSIRHSETSETR